MEPCAAISRRGTECLTELQAEGVQMTWGRSGRASGTSRSTTVQVPAASDDRRAACLQPLRAAAAVELGCSGGAPAPCDSVAPLEQDCSGRTQPECRSLSAALLSLEQNGTTAAVRRAAPCRRVQQIQADVGNGRRNRTEIEI